MSSLSSLPGSTLIKSFIFNHTNSEMRFSPTHPNAYVEASFYRSNKETNIYGKGCISAICTTYLDKNLPSKNPPMCFDENSILVRLKTSTLPLEIAHFIESKQDEIIRSACHKEDFQFSNFSDRGKTITFLTHQVL